ncbi:hypothetical protein L3V82_09520 [Thiotrichales bacterium 19S3-7]|nr:hypothetical protein [Thiotrichales bacterium 19S3-7]MCF6802396.1 hypothetical protein [Thiotrichales bacterium 19S3-11]
MKRLISGVILIGLLMINLVVPTYALYTPSTDNNGYDSNDNTNQNSSTNGNNQTSGLQSQMDKKTKEALKTFKNFKFDNQAKQDFFDTVGKDPSSAEFESAGFGGDVYSDQSKFKIKDSEDSNVLGR